jgi:protein-disulfide isomerase
MYGDKLKWVWKDFPLTSIHPQAYKAGEAAHCAADQGKYWEYHDKLFSNQRALQVESLKKHAAEIGLQSAAFDGCLDSGKYTERVRQGMEQGSQLGVESTPTVFINGRVIMGSQPIENFKAIIDDELQRAGRR